MGVEHQHTLPTFTLNPEAITRVRNLACELANHNLRQFLQAERASDVPYGPVDIEKIVALHPEIVFPVEYLDTISAKGYITNSKREDVGATGYKIQIKNGPMDEERITIAHELGHLILWKKGRHLTHNETESFCEEFASYLLFPRTLVYQWLAENNWQISIKSILQASKHFQIPLDVVVKRLGDEQDLVDATHTCALISTVCRGLENHDGSQQLRVVTAAIPSWLFIPPRAILAQLGFRDALIYYHYLQMTRVDASEPVVTQIQLTGEVDKTAFQVYPSHQAVERELVVYEAYTNGTPGKFLLTTFSVPLSKLKLKGKE